AEDAAERLHDYSLALERMTEAEALFEEIGWSFELAQVEQYAGIYHAALGHGTQAITCLEQASALYAVQSNGDTAHVQTLLGHVLAAFGSYERALETLTGALTAMEQRSDVHGMAFCHREIGYCYLGLNQLDKSIRHLQQGLELWQQLRDRPET